MTYPIKLQGGDQLIPLMLSEDEVDTIVTALEAETNAAATILASDKISEDEREFHSFRHAELESLFIKIHNISTQVAFGCVDCSVNTSFIHEYYVVHDAIWEESGLELDDGMLCIGCLESRIGRQLTADDFQDLPVNTDDSIIKSDRYKDRLGRKR